MTVHRFLLELQKAQAEKNSVLCVGLDPALPSQRSRDVIPQSYATLKDENEARLKFCTYIIKETKDYACAFKANLHYLSGFRTEDHQALTKAIKDSGCVSILDCKLNDISETIQAAIFHFRRWGYDSITFNPFLGNLEAVLRVSRQESPELGILVLTLTSNPEARRYMKESYVSQGKPLFLAIAEEVKALGADGCIVGATGWVSEEDIKAVRRILGTDRAILFPGIGAQAGDPEKIVRAGRGGLLIVNVGRSIIYAPSPKDVAKHYARNLNALMLKET
ncbi:orotidine 5'-phosphate decarboxylase [Candidatus Bathyarchaeota archaeon]|nr:orotidine 5'-phosphate decarboxylase [Candidatus Bathyarchaeota archaeon]MBS7628115.1 orotidine 5'-phosphate decarboxylase [Candidatus Bathyarchaeota archaeon]